jgi:hypothetical protein
MFPSADTKTIIHENICVELYFWMVNRPKVKSVSLDIPKIAIESDLSDELNGIF